MPEQTTQLFNITDPKIIIAAEILLDMKYSIITEEEIGQPLNDCHDFSSDTTTSVALTVDELPESSIKVECPVQTQPSTESKLWEVYTPTTTWTAVNQTTKVVIKLKVPGPGRRPLPSGPSRERKGDSVVLLSPSLSPASQPPGPWNLPPPSWAFVYQVGKLGELGLVAGQYGPQAIVTPPGKRERRGKPGDVAKGKPPSWNYALYTILARIPGGRAEKNVLFLMAKEWCSVLPPLDQSCRAALAKGDEFFSVKTCEETSSCWRLADLGEVPTDRAKGGPKKRFHADLENSEHVAKR